MLTLRKKYLIWKSSAHFHFYLYPLALSNEPQDVVVENYLYKMGHPFKSKLHHR